MVRMLLVLGKLGIIPASNFIGYCNKKGKARIYQVNRKKMDLVKHHHLVKHHQDFVTEINKRREKESFVFLAIYFLFYSFTYYLFL